MKLWNKLAQDARVMGILSIANGIQFLIILGLLLVLMRIPTRFTFHIPPDLSNGVTLTANQIPAPYVGEFAFYIWQALNDWQTDGAKDFGENLQKYGPYLSPAFRYTLAQEEKQLSAEGAMQGRVRLLRLMPGTMPKVTALEANTWAVTLDLRESEYVNGILIKDKEIEYPFRVAAFNGDAQANPFGLVLDGFIDEPKILSTLK